MVWSLRQKSVSNVLKPIRQIWNQHNTQFVKARFNACCLRARNKLRRYGEYKRGVAFKQLHRASD